MPSCVITVYGSGHARLVHELVGMLAHRRVDLRSVSATIEGGDCRIQLGVEAVDERAIDVLVKRVNRIVGVAKTVRVEDGSTHQRSVTMVSVNADAVRRTQVLELARALDAEVVEITSGTVVLCFVGPPEREREVLDLLEPFGVEEIAKSDRVVVRRTRLPRTTRTKRLSVVSA